MNIYNIYQTASDLLSEAIRVKYKVVFKNGEEKIINASSFLEAEKEAAARWGKNWKKQVKKMISPEGREQKY